MLMNASGCWSSSLEELQSLERLPVDLLVSKTSTLQPRKGNPSPRVLVREGFSFNAVGLENPGLEYFLGVREKVRKPLVISFLPETREGVREALQKMKGGLLELNLSCPNVKGTLSLLEVLEVLEELSHSGRELSLPEVGLKLPLFTEPEGLVELLLQHPGTVHWITLGNTLPGELLDPETGAPMLFQREGGVGGGTLWPFTLRGVRALSRLLREKGLGEVKVLGCGGVNTGAQVLSLLEAGAVGVQVGTALLEEGPGCFTRILGELKEKRKKKARL